MKRTVSILLVSALLLSLAGCQQASEPQGSQSSQSSQQDPTQAVFTALKEPTYPEFPQFPKNPDEDPSIDWQTYYNAHDEYYSAVMELRGGGIPALHRCYALPRYAPPAPRPKRWGPRQARP